MIICPSRRNLHSAFNRAFSLSSISGTLSMLLITSLALYTTYNNIYNDYLHFHSKAYRTGNHETIILPVHIDIHYGRPGIKRNTDRRTIVILREFLIQFIINPHHSRTGQDRAGPYIRTRETITWRCIKKIAGTPFQTE